MNIANEMLSLIRVGAQQQIELERAGRYMGESDDQHTARTDAALQDRLFAAAAEMEAAINAVNANSSVMEISLGSFQDWRHDNCVASREYWDSKLQERG